MARFAIEETLEFAQLLARHIQETDLLAAVVAILMELNIVPNNIGYYYLRDAILISYEKPGEEAMNGVYLEVAQKYGAGVDVNQVEQAIRKVIIKAWKKRNENSWNLFFRTSGMGSFQKPPNEVFFTEIARFLELWQGCCRKEACYEK